MHKLFDLVLLVLRVPVQMYTLTGSVPSLSTIACSCPLPGGKPLGMLNTFSKFSCTCSKKGGTVGSVELLPFQVVELDQELSKFFSIRSKKGGTVGVLSHSLICSPCPSKWLNTIKNSLPSLSKVRIIAFYDTSDLPK